MKRFERTGLAAKSTWLVTLIAAGVGSFAACRSTKPASVSELSLEGTAQLTELIGETVDDDERAAAARTVLVAYGEDERAYVDRLREHRRALFRLNRRYDTPRSEFEAALTRQNAERRRFRDRTLQMIAQLKQHVDADEWQVLFEGIRAHDKRWEELVR